ncbi:MAG: DUF6326 family protein [Acidimicrobiia bacterium]|nr:DUF6326 family protein [Acidimicrobiia bacterium]
MTFPATLSSRTAGPQLLSTIWISVLLSMLFRDVHEYLREGFIAELANSGTVNGGEVTGTTLLVSGIVLQLPLAMVVLARVLPRRTNRLANIMVAAIMAMGVAGTWPKDADDIVFGIFQLASLAFIAVISYRWSNDDAPHEPVALSGHAKTAQR